MPTTKLITLYSVESDALWLTFTLVAAAYLWYACYNVFPLWARTFLPRKKSVVRNSFPSSPPALVKRGFKADYSDTMDKEFPSSILSMDFKYLSYLQYLWASTFIAPCVSCLALFGATKLLIRSFLLRIGILQLGRFDAAHVTGELLLGSSLVIHFSQLDLKTGDAIFVFPDICYLDQSGSITKDHCLEVHVNVETKTISKALLDNAKLTAYEAMNLLTFVMNSLNHARLHAFSNWGTDHEKSHDTYYRRSSVTTTTYNYYGYRAFAELFPTWNCLGLLSTAWTTETFVALVDQGMEAGIVEHSIVSQLMKYSKYVDFVVKTRAIFLREFVKHKDSFPNCNCEAMFVGTVLHSIDHLMLKRIVQDPLWLSTDCPKFGLLGECNRIILSCFNDDLPFLYFNKSKSFKGSGHHFFEAVYQKAVKVNKDLAENLDTCIVK